MDRQAETQTEGHIGTKAPREETGEAAEPKRVLGRGSWFGARDTKADTSEEAGGLGRGGGQGEAGRGPHAWGWPQDAPLLAVWLQASPRLE